MAKTVSSDPRNLDELLQRGYRYALALAHNRSVAEDLVQDACLAMSRQKKQHWEVGYFLTTIRNRWIDLRRRSREVELDASPSDDGLAVEAESTLLEMEEYLSRLNSDERELLYLSAVEGYSAKELARLTQRPRGTVLSLLHRTKQKLKRLMVAGKEGDGE